MLYVLYTKSNCTNCIEAKKFLENRKLSYKEVIIGEDVSIDWIRNNFPEARTAPVITLDDEFIGSYKELVNGIN